MQNCFSINLIFVHNNYIKKKLNRIITKKTIEYNTN